MKLTDRDKAILEFLINVSPTTSETLAQYTYSSLQVIQRRLMKLADTGYVKRIRDNVNENYMYYTERAKPINTSHKLILSKLYVMWYRRDYEILLFKREVKLCKGIVSDAVALVKYGNEVKLYIIEVDIWTNPSDKLKKYKQHKDELDAYTDKYNIAPTLLFITDKHISSSTFELELLKLDFYKELVL